MFELLKSCRSIFVESFYFFLAISVFSTDARYSSNELDSMYTYTPNKLNTFTCTEQKKKKDRVSVSFVHKIFEWVCASRAITARMILHNFVIYFNFIQFHSFVTVWQWRRTRLVIHKRGESTYFEIENWVHQIFV